MSIFAALTLAAAVAASPADFAWIGGAWLSCRDGRSAEEHWAGPSALGMVGVGLTRNGARGGYEHMRIGRTDDGAWAFFGAPDGASPTAFRLTKLEGAAATFENPAHDFPKRVRYWREGELLKAMVDGGDGEGPSWTYRPMARGETCPK